MKNILIISSVFPPEPVVSAKVSYDLAIELSKENCVTVVSPEPTRPLGFQFKKVEFKLSFKHITLSSFTSAKSSLFGRVRESYSFGRRCQKFIKNNNSGIDLIYQNSWPLFAQYYIIKTAKNYKIPIITHIQDIYPDSFSNKIPVVGSLIQNALLPIDKYILKNSDKIICISDNMKKILKETRNIKDAKFFTVQNWQDEDQFIKYAENKAQRESSKTFTYMYLGNNGPVAGVEFLINCFVKANVSNSQLIIAGGGSKTEACKNLVKNLGVNNIIFKSVEDGKVPETQDMADVMLLPLKKGAAMSSIPSKLPAYMFSKKPIIGSLDLESDTSKAIYTSNCGIVVEPENEEKLVSAMKEISTWDSLRIKRSGGNGFRYAIENLSKRTNLNKVVMEILSLS